MFKLTLHDNEELIGMYRKAEIFLAKYAITIMVAIYIPYALVIRNELLYQLRWYLLVWTLLVLTYGIVKYLLWLLNVYIITTQRVIKVSYKSLVIKEVLETPLSNITHIGYSHKGIMATLCRFGNVEIHCAGTEQGITIEAIKEPEVVQHSLWKLVKPA